MPTETLIAIIAITTPFVIFALTLGLTDYRTHHREPSPHHVPAE